VELVVEVSIEATCSEQRGVGAALSNVAVLDHQNLISILNSAQAVSNRKACSASQKPLERLLDHRFCAGIYIARRLIKKEDGRVSKHGTRKGEQLAGYGLTYYVAGPGYDR